MTPFIIFRKSPWIRNLLLIILCCAQHCIAQTGGTDKIGNAIPGAPTVDVETLCALTNGVCIVKKGKLEALIDIRGNFIVPWGTYNFSHFRCNDIIAYSGLIQVQDPASKKMGYINLSGDVIIPLKHDQYDLSTYEYGEICRLKNWNSAIATILFDKSGKKIGAIDPKRVRALMPSNSEHVYMQENKLMNRYFFEDLSTKGYLKGYTDKFGRIKINGRFQYADEFSEGLAAVAIVNEFGKIQWGYVDSNGAMAIPFRFTNRPGPFHNGLALVKAVDNPEFDFAYIDRNGNPIIKINTPGQPRMRPVNFDLNQSNSLGNYDLSQLGRFLHGISFWKSTSDVVMLLTPQGRIMDLKQFLSSNNYDFERYNYRIARVEDYGIVFNKKRLEPPFIELSGLVDFNGNEILPPLFADIAKDHFSDNAFVSYPIFNSDQPNKILGYRNGIVNKKGEFILLFDNKKSTW